jgi:hypothetical protein
MPRTVRLPVSYVLPLRRRSSEGIDELAAYLAAISPLVEEVIVVDGSPEPVFEAGAAALGGLCRHTRPHADLAFAMGKVNGVTTGVREARCDRVVIADDDVRYDAEALRRVAEGLDRAELVRPQNHFAPLVWHARWDTARTLLNRVASGDPRCLSADFPGTLGVRRGLFLRTGGYDGDVIFENLELIRTVRAAGGRVASPLDLYVARRPPSTSHFLSQRVRQAYDDLALPLRMGAFLALAPSLALALARGWWAAIAAAVALIVIAAELGRRRAGGRRVFPLGGALLAPAWVLERALTVWLALGQRVAYGGVRYGDVVIRRAANSQRRIAARLRRGVAGPSQPPASAEPLAASKPISL